MYCTCEWPIWFWRFFFGFFLVLSKTIDYSPWVERKNWAKTLRHGTGWEGTKREVKQRERRNREKDRKLESDVHVDVINNNNRESREETEKIQKIKLHVFFAG